MSLQAIAPFIAQPANSHQPLTKTRQRGKIAHQSLTSSSTKKIAINN